MKASLLPPPAGGTQDASVMDRLGPEVRPGQKEDIEIDVRKAHLHAHAIREVYVQPPPEGRASRPGMCWKLKRCLHGTRDAPARWEALETQKLKG